MIEQHAIDDTEAAAPASPASADFLASAAAFTGEVGELAAGVAETMRLETELNVELVKALAVTRIAEIVGWSFAWAIVLIVSGYATFSLTANPLISFAVVGALQIAALAVLAYRRRKYRQLMGFGRTRALLTGDAS